MKKSSENERFRGSVVGVGRLELPASTSQMSRATNCAIPRKHIIADFGEHNISLPYFGAAGKARGGLTFPVAPDSMRA